MILVGEKSLQQQVLQAAPENGVALTANEKKTKLTEDLFFQKITRRLILRHHPLC
jgi:hypothetical protein